MSQVLTKPRIQRAAGLIQDVFTKEETAYLRSKATVASCYVCDKGLKDGHSLTARIVGGETVLLCDVHLGKKITR